PGASAQFVAEGSVLVGGAALQWLRDGLGVIATAAESESLAAGLPSTEGVFFVPALTGLGSPQWDPGARGLICGLTRARPARISCVLRSRRLPTRWRTSSTFFHRRSACCVPTAARARTPS